MATPIKATKKAGKKAPAKPKASDHSEDSVVAVLHSPDPKSHSVRYFGERDACVTGIYVMKDPTAFLKDGEYPPQIEVTIRPIWN